MADRGAPTRGRARCRFALAACLAALALALVAGPAHAARGANNPIGAHSMLYLNHPYSAKEAMFREAAAMHASTIRLDIELSAG